MWEKLPDALNELAAQLIADGFEEPDQEIKRLARVHANSLFPLRLFAAWFSCLETTRLPPAPPNTIMVNLAGEYEPCEVVSKIGNYGAKVRRRGQNVASIFVPWSSVLPADMERGMEIAGSIGGDDYYFEENPQVQEESTMKLEELDDKG